MRFLKQFAFLFVMASGLLSCSENPRPDETTERNREQDTKMGLLMETLYEDDFTRFGEGLYKHTEVANESGTTVASGELVAVYYELWTIEENEAGQYEEGHLIEKLVQTEVDGRMKNIKTSVVFSEGEREIVKEEDDPLIFQVGSGNTFPLTFNYIADNMRENEEVSFYLTGQYGYGTYSYHKIGVTRWQPLKLKIRVEELFDEEGFEKFEENRILREIDRDRAYYEENFPEFSEVNITENGTHVYTLNRDTIRNQEDTIQRKAKVDIDYTGRLFRFDSLVFDTSIEDTARTWDLYSAGRTYEPFNFEVGVGSVITGWDEAMVELFKYELAVLYIPSSSSYGGTAQGGRLVIPEFLREDLENNSNITIGNLIKPWDPLKFSVEVIEVNNPEE
ncbi:FKBP-type peptidyl-prolyl cis-trans isomerase [Persicobacter diffluens]|uniref:peptidylprolyl isomerase n=1 Tax=Persicobacter diffluens TaxID=981 RepID=A0AAN4W0J1_9BACT|nr:hypothetical protein PEDI_22670 [Persicobacter diffluens]